MLTGAVTAGDRPSPRGRCGTLARTLRLIGVLVFAAFATFTAFASSPVAGEARWIEDDAAGGRRLHLYFFWTEGCPHCQAARPFVEALAVRHPWLLVHSRALDDDPDAVRSYLAMAAELGEPASSVPAFVFCGRLLVGFDHAQGIGQVLEEALLACRDDGMTGSSASGGVDGAVGQPLAIDLPLLGSLTPEQLSLPLFTLVIAGLDAFNPCAFFVLLFLLSLLVHARSRARMLFIGLVFVLFSGLIYFAFMAAWLNAFRWLGEIALVTRAAGVLAIGIALINVKDYFWFRKGVSLSIPDAARPGLYQRVRGLLRADNLPALTLGTVTLAVAANSYELLCTAGFPMVYTRLLTLAELAPWQHYAYLVAYNLVYVVPLLVITLAFTYTLGSRKLSEREGRFLKLLSGSMMLALGVLLVAVPAALNDLRVALLVPLLALGGSWIVHRLMQRHASSGAGF